MYTNFIYGGDENCNFLIDTLLSANNYYNQGIEKMLTIKTFPSRCSYVSSMKAFFESINNSTRITSVIDFYNNAIMLYYNNIAKYEKIIINNINQKNPFNKRGIYYNNKMIKAMASIYARSDYETFYDIMLELFGKEGANGEKQLKYETINHGMDIQFNNMGCSFQLYVPENIEINGSSTITVYFDGTKTFINEGPSGLYGMFTDGRSGFASIDNGIVLFPYDREDYDSIAGTVTSIVTNLEVDPHKISLYGYSAGGTSAMNFANYCSQNDETSNVPELKIANVFLQSAANAHEIPINDKNTQIDDMWGAPEGNKYLDIQNSFQSIGENKINLSVEISVDPMIEQFLDSKYPGKDITWGSHENAGCVAILQHDFNGMNSIDYLTSYTYEDNDPMLYDIN